MMPKRDTIDAITRLNPTANPEFLSEFSGEELDQYLGRLSTRPKDDPLGDMRFVIELEGPASSDPGVAPISR